MGQGTSYIIFRKKPIAPSVDRHSTRSHMASDNSHFNNLKLSRGPPTGSSSSPSSCPGTVLSTGSLFSVTSRPIHWSNPFLLPLYPLLSPIEQNTIVLDGLNLLYYDIFISFWFQLFATFNKNLQLTLSFNFLLLNFSYSFLFLNFP